MAESTNIAWCDHTFNPWSGCTKVSEACAHCYAENAYTIKARGIKWGPQGTRVRAADNGWKLPERWNRKAALDGVRRRVFCASLADVFEDWRGPILDHHGYELWRCNCGATHGGDENNYRTRCAGPPCPKCGDLRSGALTMNDLRRDLFGLIDRTPNLDWLLLTKRPENIQRMWPKEGMPPAIPNRYQTGDMLAKAQGHYRFNVWLGTTVELAKYRDRIDELLKMPAPVHFVSHEPGLEAIDFSPYLAPDKVNWLITGGESKQGKDHQPSPYNIDAARSVIEQCRQAGVSPFVKQLGSNPVMPAPNQGRRFGATVTPMTLKHPKGETMAEWPEDIQVQEFPKIAVTA